MNFLKQKWLKLQHDAKMDLFERAAFAHSCHFAAPRLTHQKSFGSELLQQQMHKGQTSKWLQECRQGVSKMPSRAWAEAKIGQHGNTMIVTDLKKPWLCSTEFAQLGCIHCTAPVFQIIRRVLLQLAGGLPGTTSCCARCVSDASGETLVQISQLPSPATVHNATMIV